jgi:uncharacterized glyoxalase superfamily protein PhnB
MSEDSVASHELHGIQPVLGVRDVAKTLGYYRDVLGFHVDFVHGDPPVHARVCADRSYATPTIHIRFEPLKPDAEPSPTVYFYIHVGKGLDELFQAYRDRGVKIIRDPEDRPWGLREFYIEDCDGYTICFAAESRAA